MGNCNHYFPLYIVNKMHTDEAKLEQNAHFTVIFPCLNRYTLDAKRNGPTPAA